MDIVLGILLLLSVVKGWRSGAFAMLVSIALMIFAGVMASAFASRAGAMLGIGSATVRPIVGFFFSFLVLMVLGGALIRLIKPKAGLLRGMDAAVGAFLGLLRGAFIISVILLLMKLVHLPPQQFRRDSKLYPLILHTSTTVISTLRPLLPDAIPGKGSDSTGF